MEGVLCALKSPPSLRWACRTPRHATATSCLPAHRQLARARDRGPVLDLGPNWTQLCGFLPSQEALPGERSGSGRLSRWRALRGSGFPERRLRASQTSTLGPQIPSLGADLSHPAGGHPDALQRPGRHHASPTLFFYRSGSDAFWNEPVPSAASQHCGIYTEQPVSPLALEDLRRFHVESTAAQGACHGVSGPEGRGRQGHPPAMTL